MSVFLYLLGFIAFLAQELSFLSRQYLLVEMLLFIPRLCFHIALKLVPRAAKEWLSRKILEASLTYTY